MLKNFGKMVFFIISVVFLVSAWRANTDLIDGRHVLFMDEQIIFDGIRDLINAPTFKDKIHTSLNGDSRYGRSFFDVTYVAAIIPFKWGGYPAMIVTERMVQSFFLLAAYIILCFVCVRTWLLRSLLLLLFVGLPSTVYYACMPKPEPLQLFFLTVFLVFACRNRMQWGWYWILLGLSMGTKISTLPLVLFFAGAATYSHRKELFHIATVRAKVISAGFFCVGFLVAQGTMIRVCVDHNLEAVKQFVDVIRRESAVSGLGMLERFLSWVHVITGEYSRIPFFLLIIVSVLITTWVVMEVVNLIKKFCAERTIKDEDSVLNPALIVGCAGIVMLGFIILFAGNKRFFYLHLGAVLGLSGLVGMCEAYIMNSQSDQWRKRVASILIAVLAVCAVWSLPGALKDFNAQATRTRQGEHQQKLAQYEVISKLVDVSSQAIGRRLNIFFDPFLYQLESNKDYHIERFWGKFSGWSFGADMIIYYKESGSVDPKEEESYVCQDLKEVMQGKQCFYMPYPLGLDKVNALVRVDVMAVLAQQGMKNR